MVIVSFLAVSLDGQRQQQTFWADSAESCFKTLTELTKMGWHLLYADLVCGSYQIMLPVEVFDGEEMDIPIKKLQQEWENLLT